MLPDIFSFVDLHGTTAAGSGCRTKSQRGVVELFLFGLGNV